MNFLGLDVAPWMDGDWAKAYATSPYMSTNSWLFFRFLVMMFFVVHYVLDLMEYWPAEHFMYFIYLSRWTTTTETLMEILHFLVTFWASILVQYDIQTSTIPVLVKVHIALLSMLLPASLLSSTLYWALSPYLPPPYISAACHGGDVIVLNLSFFLGRFPFAWNKIGWIGVYGTTFSIWTVFHYFLHIGRDATAPCDYPTLSECPIYAQIDWHYPVPTSILVLFGAVAGPPLLGGLYTWLARLRDGCDQEAKEMREMSWIRSQPKEEPQELKNEPMYCATTPLNCGV